MFDHGSVEALNRLKPLVSLRGVGKVVQLTGLAPAMLYVQSGYLVEGAGPTMEFVRVPADCYAGWI